MQHKMLAVALLAAAAAGQAGAQSFEGEVALSFGKAPFLSTDDDDVRQEEQSYGLSGWAGVNLGDYRVTADVNAFTRSIGTEDFDEYAPGGARSYGLHFGRTFGAAYAGAFLGRNEFQSDDTATGNGYMSGKVFGVEGQYDLGAISVFGQIGRAELRGDDFNDNGFIGNFQRLGMSATLDKLTLTASVEQGRSPGLFEDGGDWGEYRVFSLGADYQITERLIGTVGYRTMDITANTEDSGYDDAFAVGIRIPLGASAGKRNNLTTSYYPGLAAAWAATLD
jgi:hypothetical protein